MLHFNVNINWHCLIYFFKTRVVIYWIIFMILEVRDFYNTASGKHFSFQSKCCPGCLGLNSSFHPTFFLCVWQLYKSLGYFVAGKYIDINNIDYIKEFVDIDKFCLLIHSVTKLLCTWHCQPPEEQRYCPCPLV